MPITGKTFRDKKPEVKKSDLEKDWSIVSALYKDARDKREEIKILSQLYVRSERDIANFLLSKGYNDKYIQSCIRR